MAKLPNYFQSYNAEERKIIPKGLDTSRFQYPVNELTQGKVVEHDNVEFVILRAGIQNITNNGYTKDSEFTKENIYNYRSLGIKVGSYYYARHLNIITLKSIYPGGYTENNIISEATKEANNYADILESEFGIGECGDVIPALDFEDNRIWDDLVNYPMTPEQAYLWITSFKNQMVNRFPELAKRGGVLLYTGYYYVDLACNGDIRNANGEGIAKEIPKLWFPANAVDIGIHHAGSMDYPNYNFKTFGGYTYWLIWQYSTDLNRLGYSYGFSTPSVDLNVVDTFIYKFDDILVDPKICIIMDLINSKSLKNHTHKGEYLPLQDGYLQGKTEIITPDGFVFKQVNNISWKLGRTNVSTSEDHLASELQLVPSIDFYVPTYNFAGEIWNIDNAIIFKPDGTITVKGEQVLTNPNNYYTSDTIDQLLSVQLESIVSETDIALIEQTLQLQQTDLDSLTQSLQTQQTELIALTQSLQNQQTELNLIEQTLQSLQTEINNKVSLTIPQKILATHEFINGTIVYSKRFATESIGINQFAKLCTIEITSSWNRAAFEISLMSSYKIGTIIGYIYHTNTYNTKSSNTYIKLFSHSSIRTTWLEDEIFILEYDDTTQNIYRYEIWVKALAYSKNYYNTEHSYVENGANIIYHSDIIQTSLPQNTNLISNRPIEYSNTFNGKELTLYGVESPVRPTDPAKNKLWLDTSVIPYVLKYYDGITWKTVSSSI